MLSRFKVCLIFSPFASFSYVPLGISYLKSFIQAELPTVEVKNIDLSNDFYASLDSTSFLKSLLNLCQACPKCRELECGGIFKDQSFEYFGKAAAFFKQCLTDPKTSEFYDIYKYNQLRELHDSLYIKIQNCVLLNLKHSLERGREKIDVVLKKTLLESDVGRIVSEKPDVVGFSVFSAQQFFYSLLLAKVVKNHSGAKTVFGGAYISHLDREALLKGFNFIDFIIYKEGELGFVGLLNNLKKKNFKEVPNLVYRQRGRIIENRESCISNLDNIPFPNFDDYDLKRYFSPQPVLSTMLSRGCFWKSCTFCAHHKTYSNPYRIRSITNIIQELKLYQKEGIKHIWIVDETVAAVNLDLLNKALLKEKVKIHYGVMLRATKDFTKVRLKRMFNAGCRVIAWGVESSSQRVLDLMNKGTAIKDVENLLKISSNIGLSNIAYMIQGFPTQTKAEAIKDTEFLIKNSKYISYLGAHPFWLEVDTFIFNNPKKFGVKNIKKTHLLRSKNFKIYSPEAYFINEKTLDYDPSEKDQIEIQNKYMNSNKFKDCGLFYSREHMLLHAAKKTR